MSRDPNTEANPTPRTDTAPEVEPARQPSPATVEPGKTDTGTVTPSPTADPTDPPSSL